MRAENLLAQLNEEVIKLGKEVFKLQSQLKKEREKFEAIELFLSQKHEIPVEGLPSGNTSEDYIILVDGDFYWDSDFNGNNPMNLNDLYELTQKQR